MASHEHNAIGKKYEHMGLYISPQIKTPSYYAQETQDYCVKSKCATAGERVRYELEHMSACPEEEKNKCHVNGRYICLAMEEIERKTWLDNEMTFLSEEQIFIDNEYMQLMTMNEHINNKQEQQDKQQRILDQLISENAHKQELTGIQYFDIEQNLMKQISLLYDKQKRIREKRIFIEERFKKLDNIQELMNARKKYLLKL
jgi:hypothetical protein